MPLHAVKTLETNVVVPGYGPVPNAQTTVNITQDAFEQIPASMFSNSKIEDMGLVPDSSDGVVTQAAVVAAPAALTSAAATGGDAPTEAEYNALRTDVNNLRGTVASLLTALKGVGKPMAPS